MVGLGEEMNLYFYVNVIKNMYEGVITSVGTQMEMKNEFSLTVGLPNDQR